MQCEQMQIQHNAMYMYINIYATYHGINKKYKNKKTQNDTNMYNVNKRSNMNIYMY